MLSERRCPLRLDPHQEARIAASSLLAYRKAARLVATCLIEIGFAPECETDWDEVLIEYKNWLPLQKRPSRTEDGVAIAALIMWRCIGIFYMRLTGGLRWALGHICPCRFVHLGAVEGCVTASGI